MKTSPGDFAGDLAVHAVMIVDLIPVKADVVI
jgi:hypothetical protein